MKILLSSASLDNRGHMGVLTSMFQRLQREIPGADITVMSRTLRRDREILARWVAKNGKPVPVIGHPWYVETDIMLLSSVLSAIKFLLVLLFHPFRSLSRRRAGLRQYDVIIDLQLSEVRDTTIFNAMASIFVAMNLFYFTLSRKPVIAANASIGKPFRWRPVREVSKAAFDRLHTLISRDDFTTTYIKSMGVRRPQIATLPDTSFLLAPDTGRANRMPFDRMAHPTVGMVTRDTFSSGLNKTEHISFLARLADYVTGEMKGTVILIPYSYSGFFDDRKVIQGVYAQTSNRERITIVSGELLPDELKGLISRCHILVSWRFHPCLQAVSLGVPTIGFTGEGKIKFAETIGKMAGQSAWLIETEGKEAARLLQETAEKLRSLWADYERVRDELTRRAADINARAATFVEIVQSVKS